MGLDDRFPSPIGVIFFLIIEIGDFIVTYYNIISSTGNTITFPKDNKEAGKDLRILFNNTLLARYAHKINTYVRIGDE